MKPKHKRPVVQVGGKFWSLVSLVGLVLFVLSLLYMQGYIPIYNSTPRWSSKYEIALQWTVRQMELKESGLYKRVGQKRPTIAIVSKEAIKSEYRRHTRKSMKEFYSDLVESGYTPEKAKAEVEGFLNAPIALYDPAAFKILIGNTESKCRREARIVHEIAHFLQSVTQGRIDMDDLPLIIYHISMRREFEASNIERLYGAETCPEEAETWKFYM